MDKSQRQLMDRLQSKWLQRMEALLDSGEITSTDMSTLYRFLRDNGWDLNINNLPMKLRDKLTSSLDPAELDDELQQGFVEA